MKKMSFLNFVYAWKYLLVIPHLLCYKNQTKDNKELIEADLKEMNSRCHLAKGLSYYLVFRKSYRNLFYYRVGKRSAAILKIFLPADKLFWITNSIEKIGGGAFVLNHPYCTIMNAKSIGNNFTVCHLTTIGKGKHGRSDLKPIIGDNVSLGANVTIIGDITIGNNVVVGAGSVVVKSVPDNCVIAGNPAKIIRINAANENI